jgi:excisionase family DNA binding protein
MGVAPQKREWLSLNDGANYTGYSTKTLRRKISTGELPAYRLGTKGNFIRIDRADLDKLIESSRIVAAEYRAG